MCPCQGRLKHQCSGKQKHKHSQFGCFTKFWLLPKITSSFFKNHGHNTSNWALSDADTNDSESETASLSKSLLKFNNCNCSWTLSSSIHINILLGVHGNEVVERPYCSITLRSFLELPISALSLSPASKIESSSCKVFRPRCVMTHSAASYQCSNAISKFFTPNK